MAAFTVAPAGQRFEPREVNVAVTWGQAATVAASATSSAAVAVPPTANVVASSTTSTETPTTVAAPPTTTTTTTSAPAVVHHAFPVVGTASYAHMHHDYPASEIHRERRCRRWTAPSCTGAPRITTTPRPTTPRGGGRSLAVVGDDGVRYYMAHFQSLDLNLGVGAHVSAGQPVAVVGRSGDAGACHVHLGLSPNCPTPEWSVRRGVIWPWSYLDAWRAGKNTSPVVEITDWATKHRSACDAAAADPHAPEAN